MYCTMAEERIVSKWKEERDRAIAIARRREQQEELLQQGDGLCILDRVFSSFVASNRYRGKHDTLGEVIDKAVRRGISTHYRYMHAGTPYLGSVVVHTDQDHNWCNIKLCNDGFVSFSSGQRPVYAWDELPTSIAADAFKRVFAAFPKCKHFSVMFSAWMRQVDVIVVTENDEHVLITFKDGIPDMEEQVLRTLRGTRDNSK